MPGQRVSSCRNVMKQHFILLTILSWLAGNLSAVAAGEGDQVVVVYNSRVPESKGVAEHYAAMRHVPAKQVLSFDLPDSEAMSRPDFREHLQKPLLKELETRGLFHFDVKVFPATDKEPRRVVRNVTKASVRYLALCYGVPLIISNDPGLKEDGEDKLPETLRHNGAAVDSELACLPVLEHLMLAGPTTNPVYGRTNALELSPTNGVLLVTRLDGPTAAIANALVDKAMEAETNGLCGRAYFDLRGLTNGSLKMGDDWLRAAAEVCLIYGYETIVDTNEVTFPASFPLSQAAIYAGWYDGDASGPFARPTVEFMPGAFAYHLQSFSAATIRSTKRQWVGPLLDRGVTATMGCVDEPYLGGTPNIGMFFLRFVLSGFSFGEAAYAGQNFISWQTTVVGDPLYRPFARKPEDLEADLQARHSKLVEWYALGRANRAMLRSAHIEDVLRALEGYEPAKHSAVLQEKMAELYVLDGKPNSSVHALQQALKLDPTPQQQVRIMLALAGQLIALGQDKDAYEVYQQFLKDFPDYPDLVGIYKLLVPEAQKLGLNEDVVKYRRTETPTEPGHETNKPAAP